MTKPSQIRLLITVGSVIFAYWIIFYLFVFQDWYLDNPPVGLIIKTIMPVAVIIDIAGLILGCIVAAKERLKGSLVIAVYGIPLLVCGVFFWWLLFGVKI